MFWLALTSARAIITSCCCPPDRLLNNASANSVMLSSASAASTCRSSSSCGCEKRAMWRARPINTTSFTRQAKAARNDCGTMPTPPVTVTSPARAGRTPVNVSSSVLFPRPFAPSTAQTSPGWQCKFNGANSGALWPYSNCASVSDGVISTFLCGLREPASR